MVFKTSFDDDYFFFTSCSIVRTLRQDAECDVISEICRASCMLMRCECRKMRVNSQRGYK